MISLCFKWVGCGEGDFLQSSTLDEQSLKFAFRSGSRKGVFRVQLCDLDSQTPVQKGRDKAIYGAFTAETPCKYMKTWQCLRKQRYLMLL